MASNLTIWKGKFTDNPPSSPKFPGPLTLHPSGISISLCGGGMDIFWNHTLFQCSPFNILCVLLSLQMLMSVKSQECAAKCVSTQKEVLNACAKWAMEWSRTNAPVKRRVGRFPFNVYSILTLVISLYSAGQQIHVL